MTMKLAIKGVEWYLLSSLVYFQNKMLKKQMAQEIAKSSDLETTVWGWFALCFYFPVVNMYVNYLS